MKFGIGQSVRRTEDIRLVTGHGQYTDDIRVPGETHAAFLRSPHGHANILSVDIAAAQAAPGVIAVLTQDDIERAGVGPMPCMAPVPSRDGTPSKPSAKPLLNGRHVTFIGEAIAMVMAETYAQAVDAAELIIVDYEPLDAAGTLEAAPSGPQIWDTAPGNLVFDWADGKEAECEATFAKAPHVVSLDIVENRVVASPMETRNGIGVYDAATESYTLYTGSQGVGNMRAGIARMMLNIGYEKLRVVTGDVGGGFGMKGFFYPEQVLVLVAAKLIGRPVRWSADRSEGFLADAHGRDMRTKGELALDTDGHILAMRVTGTANMGGYLSQFGPAVPTIAGARIFGGLYRVPTVFVNIKGYFSNSAPVDAYRGAGRPEAAYLIERLMDAASVKTRIDRVDLRKRNLPAPEELPYRNWAGLSVDSGNFPHLLDKALKSADMAGFAARRTASEARGLKRGFGFAYYVEITLAVGSEPARVAFTENGAVELYVGTQSNGQGHETAFAQLAAERLGIPFEAVTVKQGDSDWMNGGGTAGSRSLNMAGGAIQNASDEVIRKGRAAAGQVLQAGGSAVEFEIGGGIGRFRVAETERSITIGELAVALKREMLPGFETGLDSDGIYEGKAPTFPNGCHICEVEVDPETGLVDILSYRVLDDFGRLINPMLVAGQVHGGVAQGLGQAMLENCVYDPESGQLLTASFSDYAMPRADDLPDIDFAYEEFPCTTNPMGTKGCGEAGTVGALPALIGAISDALGVVHIDMPATPERVWRALRAKAAA